MTYLLWHINDDEGDVYGEITAANDDEAKTKASSAKPVDFGQELIELRRPSKKRHPDYPHNITEYKGTLMKKFRLHPKEEEL